MSPMSKTLTIRLDDETEAALAERKRVENGVPAPLGIGTPTYHSTAEVIRKAIGERSSVVYFVSRSDGAVKIGFSASLPMRLSALRAEHGDIVLEATIPGGRWEEQWLHRRHHRDALGREWFKRSREIDAAIALAIAENGPPNAELSADYSRDRTILVRLSESDYDDLVHIREFFGGTYAGAIRSMLREARKQLSPKTTTHEANAVEPPHVP